METFLFVVTGTCLVLFVLGMFSRRAVPIPVITARFGVTFMNSFIYTSALLYQFFFWAKYFQLT